MLACLPPMPVTRDAEEAIGRLRRQAAELPA
jgi:hypothetical protein